jgi:hypothetical protein
MEFLANAIGCNMVQIMGFQAGRGGEHFHHTWLNLPGMQPDFHNTSRSPVSGRRRAIVWRVQRVAA